MSDTPRTDDGQLAATRLPLTDRFLAGWEFARTLERELAAERAKVARLREALEDMFNGWLYIRRVHGDLYGVGWDRAEDKARAALKDTDG